MQTNPAVEQNETLNCPIVRGISRVGKEKVYGLEERIYMHVTSRDVQPKTIPGNLYQIQFSNVFI